jgi:pectate lyase
MVLRIRLLLVCETTCPTISSLNLPVNSATYAYNYCTISTHAHPLSVLAPITYTTTVCHLHVNYVYLKSMRTHSIITPVFDNNNDGINTRDGAQLLVENNVWTGTSKPLYSTDAGYAVARGNDFGGANNTVLVGSLTTMPYSYTLTATASVRSLVVGSAGQTLSF